jgi:predicted RNA-binding protein with PUA-like domain
MAETQRWVFLADPKDYGWDDLVAEKTAVWDGVKNARAQNNLKRATRGDEVLIYHTAPDKAIIGIAKVSAEAAPDPSNEKLVVVKVKPVRPLGRQLPLAEMKEDPIMKEMSFVKMPRVAVQAVTAEQWARVLEVTGTDWTGGG